MPSRRLRVLRCLWPRSVYSVWDGRLPRRRGLVWLVTPLEVTVVMPCLNEAGTLATCIRKALAAMRNAGIAGGGVVADNGSPDDSPAMPRAGGARFGGAAARGYRA